MKGANWIISLLIIALITLGIFNIILILNNKQEPNIDISKLEAKIDSLSNKKDSIRTVIITVDKEILTNEKHYEKVVNNILTQPDSVTDAFTRQYLSNYATTHGYNLCRPSEINGRK